MRAEVDTELPVFPELTEAAIGAVVDNFYAKIRQNPLLGPVFARSIPDESWPEHLAIIRDFWSTVMLKTGCYQRNPFSARLRVEGIRPELFERWLHLWRGTCHDLLAPEPADAQYEKAVAIGDSLKAGLFFGPRTPRAGA